MDKQEKGRLGEDAVCKELEKRGHRIIERNYHRRTGEIDIISSVGRYVVFTEVKSRKLNSMVSGLEAVNFSKQKKIVLTADLWLTDNRLGLQPRFDVAEVQITGGEYPRVVAVHIYEEAFTGDGIYTIN